MGKNKAYNVIECVAWAVFCVVVFVLCVTVANHEKVVESIRVEQKDNSTQECVEGGSCGAN
jgi:hypothetical protein